MFCRVFAIEFLLERSIALCSLVKSFDIHLQTISRNSLISFFVSLIFELVCIIKYFFANIIPYALFVKSIDEIFAMIVQFYIFACRPLVCSRIKIISGEHLRVSANLSLIVQR